jgi:hypothetical protein
MAITCEYTSSSFQPDTTYDTCMAQASVPEGCPIYFITPTDVPIHLLTISVTDAQGNQVTATPTTTSLGTGPGYDTFTDFNDCSCPQVTVPMTTYRFATQIPAAHAGDFVTIDFTNTPSPDSSVSITDPAPCPAVDWPADYAVLSPCDRCQPPLPTAGHGGGCAAGDDSPALALATLAVALMVRRDRVTRRIG